MKTFGPAIMAAAVPMSPGAITEPWHQHQLNARAHCAGEAPESVSIHIGSACAFNGKICVALSSSLPAFQSGDEAATTMAYVIFDTDSHAKRYNLDRSEFDESCEGASAGINVLVPLNTARKEPNEKLEEMRSVAGCKGVLTQRFWLSGLVRNTAKDFDTVLRRDVTVDHQVPHGATAIDFAEGRHELMTRAK